jgi:hypothetical protein
MHVLLIAPASWITASRTRSRGGARVTLVALAHRFHARAACVDPSVDLQLIEWPRHRSFGNLRFLPCIIRLAERVQPDVVHFLCEGVVWLNIALPFFRKLGVVTTMHDVAYHPGDRSSQRVPRWCVDHLIGRSAGEQDRGCALAVRTVVTLGRAVNALGLQFCNSNCLPAAQPLRCHA